MDVGWRRTQRWQTLKHRMEISAPRFLFYFIFIHFFHKHPLREVFNTGLGSPALIAIAMAIAVAISIAIAINNRQCNIHLIGTDISSFGHFWLGIFCRPLIGRFPSIIAVLIRVIYSKLRPACESKTAECRPCARCRVNSFLMFFLGRDARRKSTTTTTG